MLIRTLRKYITVITIVWSNTMVVIAGGLLYRLVMFLLATHLLNTQIYYYQLLPRHSVTGCFTVSTVSSVSIFSNLYDRHVAVSLIWTWSSWDLMIVDFPPCMFLLCLPLHLLPPAVIWNALLAGLSWLSAWDWLSRVVNDILRSWSRVFNTQLLDKRPQ